jgi:hypothetical protein
MAAILGTYEPGDSINRCKDVRCKDVEKADMCLLRLVSQGGSATAQV